MGSPKQQASSKKLIFIGVGCGCGLLLFLVIAVTGGIWFWVSRASSGHIRFAAELDQKDPAWRLEQIEAKHKDAKLDRNGADLVEDLHPRLVPNWDRNIAAIMEDDQISRTLARDPGAAFQVRTTLAPLEAHVRRAREFANMPQGRFIIKIEHNPMDTKLEHLNRLRATARLLQAESVRKVFNNNTDEAIVAAWGIVNLGRYVKDEPFTLSHLVRDALQSLAVHRLEDALRYQTINERAEGLLEKVQAALLAESDDLGTLHSLRCERAIGQVIMLRLDNSQLTLAQVAGSMKDFPRDYPAERWAKNFPHQHLWYLQKMTDLIDISKLPAQEQRAKYKDFASALDRDAGGVGAVLLPDANLFHRAHSRNSAKLRVAAAALAVERFRRTTGQWPADLGKLVPAYLPSVPTDPFDGKALRFRVHAEGIAIFSIGPSLREQNPTFQEMDGRQLDDMIAFRLWHPENRRAF